MKLNNQENEDSKRVSDEHEHVSNVHTNTCSNILNASADCDKNNPCPSNTQCCQEINKNGSKGPVTCCANGSCNSKLGHCSVKTKEVCPHTLESFNGEKTQKPNCDIDKACANYKFVAQILAWLCFIFLIAVIIIGFRLKSLKCVRECVM
jgi:hypothetical protein